MIIWLSLKKQRLTREVGQEYIRAGRIAGCVIVYYTIRVINISYIRDGKVSKTNAPKIPTLIRHIYIVTTFQNEFFLHSFHYIKDSKICRI